MEDSLIELIEKIGYPIYKQGSFTESQEYPDTFFTFWNNQSNDHAYYSNESYGNVWDYDLNVYSVDPETIYSALEGARDILKENGWIVPSCGYDVYSDQPTHTGRGMGVTFLKTF